MNESDTDPLSVIINLFDVAMVMNMTEVFTQEDYTIVKNPGKDKQIYTLRGAIIHSKERTQSRSCLRA